MVERDGRSAARLRVSATTAPATGRPAVSTTRPTISPSAGPGPRVVRCAWTDASATTMASRVSTMGRMRSRVICAPAIRTSVNRSSSVMIVGPV